MTTRDCFDLPVQVHNRRISQSSATPCFNTSALLLTVLSSDGYGESPRATLPALCRPATRCSPSYAGLRNAS